MKPKMGCFALFISVFYLVGFAILGYSLWNARRSTQAAGWPTTPGTVTHLAIEEKSDSEGGTTYKVNVRYTYTVDGVGYEGDQLAFGYVASSGREAHDEIHSKLKNARQIAVRYDPSDPAVSCLSFGLHRSIQLGCAFAITWLAFVIGFTLIVLLASRGDNVLLENLLVE
jgi:hypothetical protein